MQGQGFENVGDKTYLYYGAADPRTWSEGNKPIPARGGVGLATLPRDRFADLRVRDYGEGQAEFITGALDFTNGQRLFVNADGLGQDAELKFELLTHDERPIPGYSGADAAVVSSAGFQVPIKWRNGAALNGLPERFKIKATFGGKKASDIRFSALYLQ
jgi:hypothetical protein